MYFSPSLAANAYVTEAWGTDFNGVFRANTLLDQIAKNGSFVGSAFISYKVTGRS